MRDLNVKKFSESKMRFPRKMWSTVIFFSSIILLLNRNTVHCAEEGENGEEKEEMPDFSEFENSPRRMAQALGETPLASNQFFISTMGRSNFNGNGTEGIEPDFSGYTCQFIGTLNCTDDFVKQCTGGGVIDCTGHCPGDESTFRKMSDMLDDEELAKEFPVLAYIKVLTKNKTQEQKDKSHETVVELLTDCGFEKMLALMDLAKSGLGEQDNSDNTSITYVAEESIAGFGDYDYDYYDDEEVETEPEEEPDSDSEPEPETHAEGSGSQTAQDKNKDPQSRNLPLEKIEKIGEEGNPNKNDKSSGQVSLENDTNASNDQYSVEIVDKATTRKEDVPIDVTKRQAEENDDMTKKLVNKSSNIVHIQSENNLMQKNKLAYKKSNQKVWPKRNVPRSVSEKYEPNINHDVNEIHEMTKNNLNEELKRNLSTSKRNRRGLRENNSHPTSNNPIYKNKHKPSKKSVMTQLQSEVKALKETFLRALDIAEHMGNAMDTLSILEDNPWNNTIIETTTSRRTRRNAKYTEIHSKGSELAKTMAEKMRMLPRENVRKIRSVAEEMKTDMMTMEDEKCEVRNLSCVVFPTVKQCQGIGVGGCVSRTQLLAMFFSPRVVYFIVITIIFCIAGGIGIAVYVFKRRSNEVVPEPGEAGNQAGSDADKEKQGDCQRAKQVPMNPGTGT